MPSITHKGGSCDTGQDLSLILGRALPEGCEYILGKIFVGTHGEWASLQTSFHEAGFIFDGAAAPNPPGTLYVHADSDRVSRVRCDSCGALLPVDGCRAAHGHWCSCGRLLHLAITAEPGRETVFQVDINGDVGKGGPRSHEVRLKLLDFNPDTSEVTLDARPLGSRYGRDTDEGVPMHPSIIQQADILQRFAHLLQPVQATQRMELGEGIGHVELDAPVPAYRFTWPYGWQKKGSAENVNGGGLAHLSPETSGASIHRSTSVTLLAGQPVGKGSKDEALMERSFYLVPSFQHSKLTVTPGLLNTMMDNMGLQGYSLFPDYISRSGGWSPTVLNNSLLTAMRLYAGIFTMVDLAAWDKAVENARGRHPAYLLLAVASVCHPESTLRCKWSGNSYSLITLDDAHEFLAAELKSRQRKGMKSMIW